MKFRKKNIFILLALGAGLLIVFTLSGTSLQPKHSKIPQLINVSGAEVIAAHTYVKGSPGVAFSLVMFTDYTSEEDASYYATLQKLYENNKKYLKIALRHFPQTKEAHIRSKAAQIAGDQGKFWEFSEELFNKTTKNLTTKELSEIAEKLSLNTKEFDNNLKNEGFDSLIDADLKDGKLLGVEKTPTFFLNETKLTAESPEELEGVVQSEIDKIKALEEKKAGVSENPTPNESAQKNPAEAQIEQLKEIKKISFTEEGWEPKTTEILKNQTVLWTNNTKSEIELEQLDPRYEGLKKNKKIGSGESFEFKFTEPGFWRYQEAKSFSWGMIFTENY